MPRAVALLPAQLSLPSIMHGFAVSHTVQESKLPVFRATPVNHCLLHTELAAMPVHFVPASANANRCNVHDPSAFPDFPARKRPAANPCSAAAPASAQHDHVNANPDGTITVLSYALLDACPLTTAAFRAITYLLPVPFPFFSPAERQSAAEADFGRQL